MLNAAFQHYNYDLYKPRSPKASSYYRCVQDHFELLEMSWPDHYESRYGFWRRLHEKASKYSWPH